MDRHIVYPSAIPLDTDLLHPQRSAMISDGILVQAMLGTGTSVCGLACKPSSSSGMQVVITPGAIFSQQTVDTTPFGSLGSDSHLLMKVGINLQAWTSPVLAAPAAGMSIAVLIEAGFAETDTDPLVLPYYNAANPAQSFAGPNNTGTGLNSRRTQRAALAAVIGPPYPTGSAPIIPPTDIGNVGLFVITLNSGTTTIGPGMISVAPGAPFIAGGNTSVGRLINIQKWTSAGTFAYTPTPGTTSRVWEVRGAGGSGGSVASTAAATSAAAGGGGGGAYVKHNDNTPSGGATIVIGQGGAAPTAGNINGYAGGQSSVSLASTGLSLVAPGGGGAGGSSAQATSAIVGPGAPGAAGTGGNILNAAGEQGGCGQTIIAGGAYYGVSGVGGRGHDGGGAALIGGTSAGNPGRTPGAGGSGAASGCVGGGGAAQSGGAGADGGVWVWEFA